MVVQGWQTSISPVSAKTLRAVNVMTARDLAHIQKDRGWGVHVLSTPSKIMLIIEYVQ